MVVPYNRGLSEHLTNLYNKVGVQVHFRGQLHWEPPSGPKDKDQIIQESGIMYKFNHV